MTSPGTEGDVGRACLMLACAFRMKSACYASVSSARRWFMYCDVMMPMPAYVLYDAASDTMSRRHLCSPHGKACR
jgi:hypothetical protein